jgi:hypothetical protein
MATDFDPDSIVTRLKAVQGARPGTCVQLSDKEASALIVAAEQAVRAQPVLLELSAPLQVVGDTGVALGAIHSSANAHCPVASKSAARLERRVSPRSALGRSCERRLA